METCANFFSSCISAHFRRSRKDPRFLHTEQTSSMRACQYVDITFAAMRYPTQSVFPNLRLVVVTEAGMYKSTTILSCSNVTK
jgi:hypothetical protein